MGAISNPPDECELVLSIAENIYRRRLHSYWRRGSDGPEQLCREKKLIKMINPLSLISETRKAYRDCLLACYLLSARGVHNDTLTTQVEISWLPKHPETLSPIPLTTCISGDTCKQSMHIERA
jgi:hypothetical protein